MITSTYTKRFEKDFKLSKRRGKDLKKLEVVLKMLVSEQSLPEKYCDHWLTGNYAHSRECHVEPDWLLIYQPKKDEIVFQRLGTHSDLFR